MRIVAGTHRSRRLATLPGDATRPSSDKLKAALFSKVGPFFDGGSALDVFAGSGAVGLEARSRGMEQVTFIEHSRAAVAIIKKNIDALKEEAATHVLQGDALRLSATLQDQYDLIFMDPPYAYPKTIEVARNLVKCVKIDGILVIETDKNTTMPKKIETLTCVETRDYGLARLHYYEML